MSKIFGVDIQVISLVISALAFLLQLISWFWATAKDFYQKFPFIKNVLWIIFFISLGVSLGIFASRKPPSTSSHWNSTTSTAFDFENPQEINDWYIEDPIQGGGLQKASDSTSTVVSNFGFSGTSSLELKRKVSISPQQETQFWIVGNLPGKIGSPSLIVGHIYFPNDPSYEVTWSQICLESDKYGWSECIGFTPKKGMWNRFAVNTQHIYFIDKATGEIEQIGIGGSNVNNIIVQGGIKGNVTDVVEYTFNIDDIEIYAGYERNK
jgi:hypothetical protein